MISTRLKSTASDEQKNNNSTSSEPDPTDGTSEETLLTTVRRWAMRTAPVYTTAVVSICLYLETTAPSLTVRDDCTSVRFSLLQTGYCLFFRLHRKRISEWRRRYERTGLGYPKSTNKRKNDRDVRSCSVPSLKMSINRNKPPSLPVLS